LVDEMVPAQLARIKNAFERGESELMVASFPGDFCTDGGRAVVNTGERPINKPTKEEEPGRQSSRLAADHASWDPRPTNTETAPKPGGFGFAARVISYPGGKPGDIGVFITWPKSPTAA
jgi:hypothetical protein